MSPMEMQCIPGGKEVFKILGIEYRETETEEREVGGGRDGGEDSVMFMFSFR